MGDRVFHHADAITLAEFKEILERYTGVVTLLSRPSRQEADATRPADTLIDLDNWRLNTLPSVIASRKSKGAFITKEELQDLTKWKLTHGTFRPRLTQLIASNSEEEVEKATKGGFASFDGTPESTRKAFKELQTLKGVGPASAALLLSVYDPEHVPFCSDEATKWILWEDGDKQGWDRALKYNPKEYLEFLAGAQKLQKRLSSGSKEKVSASDIEKVGYVIGKEYEGITPRVEKPRGGAKAKKDVAESEVSKVPSSPKKEKGSLLSQYKKRKAEDKADDVEEKAAPAPPAKKSKAKKPAPEKVEDDDEDDGFDPAPAPAPAKIGKSKKVDNNAKENALPTRKGRPKKA